ncbi:tRNA dihydrouridine synthase [Vanrija albida]|uniref:tRNA dihydrouridine synthase n=1 Tax=Vanrija albida TaxID=181172 RepID=A0ABR3PSL9_9TREE
MAYKEEDAAPWADLPTPEVLPVARMLAELETVNVLAPLVRCSKLPFRHLVSLYDTHVTTTPMILAEEFSRSQPARVSDLSTSANERGVFWMEPRGVGAERGMAALSLTHPEDAGPSRAHKTYYAPPPHTRLPARLTPPTARSRLVRGALLAQLASPNAASLADAAELIAPHVDGVDINCGCPQRWAYAEGIGCALLRKPELVADMVRATKDRLGWGFPVSIKIRVDDDPRATETLVRNALAVGVSHITIHGRTRHQASTEPVSLPAIKFAVGLVGGAVPTVANGDLWELADAKRMREETGVDGAMAARGLLANPALFAGYTSTPHHAVENFVNLADDYGFIFSLFHRHLAYMLEAHMYKPEKTYFNALASSVQVIDYLSSRGLDFATPRKIPMWDASRGYSLLP